MTYKLRPLMKNRIFAAFILAVAILGTALIIYRPCAYVFEYDAKYYPVDYGRFNFFSYFTVQSNIMVCIYLFLLAFAGFGNVKARNIAYNPTLRLFVTTYIIVTGAVYCGGIPMGMTPPLHWDTFNHIMHSFIQVFHHMIAPVLMIILFLLPPTDRKIPAKHLWAVGIYPFVYSVLSIARGALTKGHFFAYPFYRPEFFWNIFLRGREMNTAFAYLLMLPMLILGIGIFVLIAALLRLIHNGIVRNMSNTEVLS